MEIVVERRLEHTNLWSVNRTLEVRLCGAAAERPRPEQIVTVFELLTHLELPPHRAISPPAFDGDDWYAPPFTAESSWGQFVALVAIELQQAVGQPRFRTWLADATGGEPRIAFECLEFEVAAAALTAAASLVCQIHLTGACDVEAAFEAVSAADERYSLGDATGPIVAAARLRGVPVMRLDSESHVQLGEGVHARRIRKAATDATGFLAEQVSSDKASTKRLWSQLGIPVAAGRVVDDAEDAVRVAEELGWPVVVKPLDADFSNGVTLHIIDAQGVRNAYEFARKESESVLVERSLSGGLHRFLVVGGSVISAVRRDPASVTGNGRQTIRELVEAENQSPRRGPDYRWPLQRLRLEAEELAFLAEQGLGMGSFPSLGQCIELRREPYLTAGGETHELLDRVHPETLDAVRDAVRVVGLDIAGVDLIARDIALPLLEQGGGLLELNAQPAICLHLSPFNDRPQPVGEAIVDTLFPTGASGRVPLTTVVGDFEKPAELGPLIRVLSAHGQAVGVSTPGVTQVLSRQLSPLTSRPADRLAVMNLHPGTAATCLSTNVVSLLMHGLGTDHCRLLVLADTDRTNSNEHHSNAGLARLKARLLDVADVSLVNVDDPDWGRLIEPGEPSMILAATERQHPTLLRHLQFGGRIAFREGDDVVLATADGEFARRHLPTADAEGNHWLILAAALLIAPTPSRQRLRTSRARVCK